jgi:hypothetical protein
MTTYYQIMAYSYNAQQQMQEVDLTEEPTQDRAYAELRASSYAQRLNTDHYLHATDWVGRVQANEQHG